MPRQENNSLVALMNNRIDFEIAQTQNWYRIPVKSAPPIVREQKLKYLSFYHTQAFKNESHSVKWFGKVKNISIKKRKELLPQVSFDPKSENEYFKIEFEDLKELPNAIMSRRKRRILFIPTTEQKLFNSSEINYLFNNSPLEEMLWQKFAKLGITAEREYMIETKDKQYFFLDFALFCKLRNINIECDGDEYHTSKEHVQKDKRRNNVLESLGWSVLRFTIYDLKNKLNESINQICDTINKNGGIEDLDLKGNHKYVGDNQSGQMRLFD